MKPTPKNTEIKQKKVKLNSNKALYYCSSTHNKANAAGSQGGRGRLVLLLVPDVIHPHRRREDVVIHKPPRQLPPYGEIKQQLELRVKRRLVGFKALQITRPLRPFAEKLVIYKPVITPRTNRKSRVDQGRQDRKGYMIHDT